MICPRCNHPECRRSHRSGFGDYAVSVFGLRPWRCAECGRRFFGTQVAIRYMLRAHCSRCGNLDLQRISGRYGEGEFKFLWRRLGVPAYRCPNCRKHLYSWLPRKRTSRPTSQTTFTA